MIDGYLKVSYFNLARNALRQIIRLYGVNEICVPYYLCSSLRNAIKKENCKIKFYHIDKNFFPIVNFNQNDFILYVNYFGICTSCVKKLEKKYKNLIVDNSQAFYSNTSGLASFNSLRKFFPLVDGAILNYKKKDDFSYQSDDTSIDRIKFLKSNKKDFNFGTVSFYDDERFLDDGQIKYISEFSKNTFEKINVNDVKSKRLLNFKILNEKLSSSNELKINLEKSSCPFCYPYLIKDDFMRNKLKSNGIYLDYFWNPMPKDSIEGYLQKYLLPLPIDQRYDEDDIRFILNVLNK